MFRTLMPWREKPITPWTEGFSRTFARMDEEFEELLERLFHPEEGRMMPSKEWFTPRMDLTETETGYEVKVDLPGLKPEEVKVELKGNELSITGERKEEKEEKGKTFHRVERRYGEFRRILPLPEKVREEAIEAKVENGVLTVIVPKVEPVTPKTIEVKA
jgi:HSP20 family protein